MSGITYIQIESDWSDWRHELEKALRPQANLVFREAFDKLEMPLAPGCEIATCTMKEAQARYDWREGIDIIYRFESGIRATGQSKILTFYKSTLTFEEQKNSGARGAWYTCTAQYYFVGYARNWRIYNQPESKWPKNATLHDWMFIDLPVLHRLDAVGLIPWQFNENYRDGRRTSFRYVFFNDVPEDCIVNRKTQNGDGLVSLSDLAEYKKTHNLQVTGSEWNGIGPVTVFVKDQE